MKFIGKDGAYIGKQVLLRSRDDDMRHLLHDLDGEPEGLEENTNCRHHDDEGRIPEPTGR
ncbi:hypothetical protein GTO91_12365 [Heliobacterium undosum]|uniref:Uncharacterized protein n=1 Tax=Heliomicrobium undosum TaxID=121734 RepID=A0A845L9X7_9FIRM|nr:hypothetical protein [Heliomicrobium undosum]MZP30508.1 hypothetical protein [Heliomicrobium undosum]